MWNILLTVSAHEYHRVDFKIYASIRVLFQALFAKGLKENPLISSTGGGRDIIWVTHGRTNL